MNQQLQSASGWEKGGCLPEKKVDTHANYAYKFRLYPKTIEQHKRLKLDNKRDSKGRTPYHAQYSQQERLEYMMRKARVLYNEFLWLEIQEYHKHFKEQESIILAENPNAKIYQPMFTNREYWKHKPGHHVQSSDKEGIRIKYKFPTSFDLGYKFTEYKKNNPKYDSVTREVCEAVLDNLATAFKNFLSRAGVMRPPTFKSKYDNRFSIKFRKGVSIKNGKLYVAGFLEKHQDGIKIRQHCPIEGIIKSVTISKNPSGQFYASVAVHLPTDVKQRKFGVGNGGKEGSPSTVGIDLGLKDYVVTSNNDEIFVNELHSSVAMKRFVDLKARIKRLQRYLSKKKAKLPTGKFDSNGREIFRKSLSYQKMQHTIAKAHQKIADVRSYIIHTITNYLLKKYDLVAVETLQPLNMVKNKRLAENIANASFGKFIDVLQYKAAYQGKEVIKIDSFFPSSKLCNKCGWKNEKLKLNHREWDCPQCGEHHDRDMNAAINILKEGLYVKEHGKSSLEKSGDKKANRKK